MKINGGVPRDQSQNVPFLAQQEALMGGVGFVPRRMIEDWISRRE